MYAVATAAGRAINRQSRAEILAASTCRRPANVSLRWIFDRLGTTLDGRGPSAAAAAAAAVGWPKVGNRKMCVRRTRTRSPVEIMHSVPDHAPSDACPWRDFITRARSSSSRCVSLVGCMRCLEFVSRFTRELLETAKPTRGA